MRTEELLPDPPTSRALLFAGLAAVVGAAIWALLRIYAQVEHGVVAWGIGGLIGFAIVRAGGHGQLLAASGAVLAVLSIGTGRHVSYQADVAEAVEQSLTTMGEDMYAEVSRDAADWAALEAKADDDAVAEFALDHDYDVDDAAGFREYVQPDLEWFFQEKPTIEQWRDRQRASVEAFMAENFTFVDYLREDFHVLDILFVLLGLGTAFGMVSKHTAALQQQARAQLRAEREAEEAEAEAAPEAAAAPDDEQAGSGPPPLR